MKRKNIRILVLLVVLIITQPICYFVINKIKKERLRYKRHFYSDGAVKLVDAPVVNGLFEGNEKSYYYSGKIRSITPYIKGKIEGIQKIYRETGELYGEVPWEKDIRNGIMKYYYQNGKIKMESPFLHGKITGEEKFYYASGKIESIIKYITSKIVWRKKYDKSGKIRLHILYLSNGNEKIIYDNQKRDNVTSDSDTKLGKNKQDQGVK